MSHHVKPIPEGFHTVTPYLTVRNAAQALEFYKRAFGAEETLKLTMPGSSTIMHAEIRIGDSYVMLGEEAPQWGAKSPQALGGSPVSIHLYVENVDKLFQRAVAAGAQATLPPQNQFWGDRMGKLTDPFGHVWGIATHIEDVSPEECAKRAAAQFGGQCGG